MVQLEEKIKKPLSGEFVDYESISAEELIGNKKAIDMLFDRTGRRILGRLLVHKKGSSDWIYLISQIEGEKWNYIDKDHLGENSVMIPKKEAYKKFTSRLKPGYVVLRGQHAVKKYNSLKKATPSGITAKTKTTRTSTKTKTQNATRSTSVVKKTTHKTIKGQKGYSLVEKKRKGYCVPETKQTYWKRL